MSAIVYHEFEGIPDGETLKELGRHMMEVFAVPSVEDGSLDSFLASFCEGLAGHRWIHVCLAYDGHQIVGHKIGRSEDPRSFESWKGGVLSTHRRQGIAAELSRRQEVWSRRAGFGFMTTITAADNSPMLILNLRHGYHISGTRLVRGQHLQVCLEKPLKGS